MIDFTDIAFYPDEKVQDILLGHHQHPMFKGFASYVFPGLKDQDIYEKIESVHGIQDFQRVFLLPLLKRMLKQTASGFTTSRVEALDQDKPHLFISNHRDIALDASLTNMVLLESNNIMAASAIGDNLVQHPFIYDFAKCSRSFLVKRNLPVREALSSSHTLSEYIKHLILNDKRSVWIAQKEGRTKDGNDITNPGLLKMLGMHTDIDHAFDMLANYNIIPTTISYEYDPTDLLKIKEALSIQKGEKVEKEEGEDFKQILQGFLGFKGHIHLSFGESINTYLHRLQSVDLPANKKWQALAFRLDEIIQSQYKRWPSNYMAYDLLTENTLFSSRYTPKQMRYFKQRVDMFRSELGEDSIPLFLKMYAAPIINVIGRNK